jgi:hypothetical protein
MKETKNPFQNQISDATFKYIQNIISQSILSSTLEPLHWKSYNWVAKPLIKLLICF